MPYVFKTNELDDLPEAGNSYSLTSRYCSAEDGVRDNETIYVFVEDRTALGRYGGLVARGTVLSVTPAAPETTMTIRIESTAVSTPLSNISLRRFAHPQHYSLPETNVEPISHIVPLLSEIAEIRRKTTNQPVHEISQAAADWLDLYHFEKEKH